MLGSVELINADVLAGLKGLQAGSVHCIITSPPYWGLRDYGIEPTVWGDGWRGCLGLEPTPQLFVEHMVEVFREARRVLRDDGCLFVNLGDSYAGGGRGGNPEESEYRKQATNRGSVTGVTKDRWPVPSGLKPKDLVGIPWTVSLALRDDGWYLRSAMPWVKRSAMPESVRDRPASALEYVFLLSKSPRYFFDMEAVRKDGTGRRCNEFRRGVYVNNETFDNSATLKGSQGEYRDESGRAFRNTDLWYESLTAPHGLVGVGDELVGLDVNPQAYGEAHFATFPEWLVRPMIAAGTSEKGCCPECGAAMGEVEHRTLQPCTVLDPFAGSGTTLRVARLMGRNSIGIEINPDYIELAKRRIYATSGVQKAPPSLKGQRDLF